MSLLDYGEGTRGSMLTFRDAKRPEDADVLIDRLNAIRLEEVALFFMGSLICRLQASHSRKRA